MTRTGTALACALLAVVAAGGCSQSEAETPSASSLPPNDMPACEEIYVEGAEVRSDTFGLACVKDDEILSPRPVRLECTDETELYFNDLAWGFVGEGMHITPDDDPSKMPEVEVDACLAPR